jgi:hypothetical protein
MPRTSRGRHRSFTTRAAAVVAQGVDRRRAPAARPITSLKAHFSAGGRAMCFDVRYRSIRC